MKSIMSVGPNFGYFLNRLSQKNGPSMQEPTVGVRDRRKSHRKPGDRGVGSARVNEDETIKEKRNHREGQVENHRESTLFTSTSFHIILSLFLLDFLCSVEYHFHSL